MCNGVVCCNCHPVANYIGMCINVMTQPSLRSTYIKYTVKPETLALSNFGKNWFKEFWRKKRWRNSSKSAYFLGGFTLKDKSLVIWTWFTRTLNSSKFLVLRYTLSISCAPEYHAYITFIPFMAVLDGTYINKITNEHNTIHWKIMMGEILANHTGKSYWRGKIW